MVDNVNVNVVQRPSKQQLQWLFEILACANAHVLKYNKEWDWNIISLNINNTD